MIDGSRRRGSYWRIGVAGRRAAHGGLARLITDKREPIKVNLAQSECLSGKRASESRCREAF